MGPRFKGKLKNVDRVCVECKRSPVLAGRKKVHYGNATTAAEGRVSAQDGGSQPYAVRTLTIILLRKKDSEAALSN